MCTEHFTHFYCMYCSERFKKGYEWEICQIAQQTESKSMGSCGYTDDGVVASMSEYCQQLRHWAMALFSFLYGH
ncbi:Beta-mannosidase B [Fusarium oxysporum f. sp. albedinis]|nr:Beta-mannosidase B [Fusarium oxysporum f. sp. albedinis]